MFPFEPSFPAETTSTRPGPTRLSSACSNSVVPSCGPAIPPSQRFTTIGRPSRSASANSQRTPSTTRSNAKVPSPPFTTSKSAAGATPAYRRAVPPVPVPTSSPLPAAVPATCVPWPLRSRWLHVPSSSEAGGQ